MDQQTTQSKGSASRIVFGVLAIVIILALGVWLMNSTPEDETTAVEDAQDTSMTQRDDEAMREDEAMMDAEEEDAAAEEREYEDGTYTAMGEYISPAGGEEIEVSVVLEDGIVVEAEFDGKATHPTSQKLQEMFADGFEEEVVGKSLDEIDLDVVNGSSLVPRGFMDALDTIKEEAAA